MANLDYFTATHVPPSTIYGEGAATALSTLVAGGHMRTKEEDRAYDKVYKNTDGGRARLKSRREFTDNLYAKFLARMRPLKEDAPCTDCGVFYKSHVMDFDHVRGEKKRAISGMGTYNWETVLKEIDKCELVCANCHRERTHQRRRLLN